MDLQWKRDMKREPASQGLHIDQLEESQQTCECCFLTGSPSLQGDAAISVSY